MDSIFTKFVFKSRSFNQIPLIGYFCHDSDIVTLILSPISHTHPWPHLHNNNVSSHLIHLAWCIYTSDVHHAMYFSLCKHTHNSDLVPSFMPWLLTLWWWWWHHHLSSLNWSSVMSLSVVHWFTVMSLSVIHSGALSLICLLGSHLSHVLTCFPYKFTLTFCLHGFNLQPSFVLIITLTLTWVVSLSLYVNVQQHLMFSNTQTTQILP